MPSAALAFPFLGLLFPGIAVRLCCVVGKATANVMADILFAGTHTDVHALSYGVVQLCRTPERHNEVNNRGGQRQRAWTE